MKYIPYVIILLLIVSNVYFYMKPSKVITKVEEVIKWDTIHTVDTVPNVVKEYIVRYEKDTLYLKWDSVPQVVDIPITTKEYEGGNDSIRYNAVVSGFKPSLDKITFDVRYPTKETIKYVKEPKNRFNWGVGVYGGYSPFNNRFDVIVGGGFQFNF